MLRSVVTNGVVSGLIIGVPLFAWTVATNGHPPHTGLLVGYTIMLIALSVVFVAIKRRRDRDLGGVIAFWPALGLGLGISLVAGIFYVVAWEAALGVTHSDFATAYANTLIEHEKAKGVTGEALAKVTAEMERFKVQYSNPLYRVPMTFAEIFPVGILVSLISAALLRNRRFLPARRPEVRREGESSTASSRW
jgi:Protein of unknown function (DUF4199)